MSQWKVDQLLKENTLFFFTTNWKRDNPRVRRADHRISVSNQLDMQVPHGNLMAHDGENPVNLVDLVASLSLPYCSDIKQIFFECQLIFFPIIYTKLGTARKCKKKMCNLLLFFPRKPPKHLE
ncbi:hypothetical protein FKM82_002908 [Ascaphus truei]